MWCGYFHLYTSNLKCNIKDKEMFPTSVTLVHIIQACIHHACLANLSNLNDFLNLSLYLSKNENGQWNIESGILRIISILINIVSTRMMHVTVFVLSLSNTGVLCIMF